MREIQLTHTYLRTYVDVFHGMGPNGCGVPVILCPSCEASPEKTAAALCELCRKDCAAPLPSTVNWTAIKVCARTIIDIVVEVGTPFELFLN